MNKDDPDDKPFSIDRNEYFCVVEEFIEGKTLEEFCLEYGNKFGSKYAPLVRKSKDGVISYYQYSEQERKKALDTINDYNICLKFQSKMYEFMNKLCDILEYLHRNRILHLDIKPDNIMITNAGEELVLIDFGRANYMEKDQQYVKAFFDIENSDEYGTVGFAAPEAYSPSNPRISFNNESFRYFDGIPYYGTLLTVESDIFSFGATFWECVSTFWLFTNIREYAKKVEFGYHYQPLYDAKEFLNNAGYCDRDLSLANSFFHEKLQAIIKKATRQRTSDYTDEKNEEYYHSYKDLKDDLIAAKESSPTILVTEDIRVRNSYGLFGVMIASIVVLLMLCNLFLKPTGSYFAKQKIDDIIMNYDLSKTERLGEVAVEQMNSSNDSEKQDIYNRIFDFFLGESDGIQYKESKILVKLINEISSENFKMILLIKFL